MLNHHDSAPSFFFSEYPLCVHCAYPQRNLREQIDRTRPLTFGLFPITVRSTPREIRIYTPCIKRNILSRNRLIPSIVYRFFSNNVRVRAIRAVSEIVLYCSVRDRPNSALKRVPTDDIIVLNINVCLQVLYNIIFIRQYFGNGKLKGMKFEFRDEVQRKPTSFIIIISYNILLLL